MELEYLDDDETQRVLVENKAPSKEFEMKTIKQLWTYLSTTNMVRWETLLEKVSFENLVLSLSPDLIHPTYMPSLADLGVLSEMLERNPPARYSCLCLSLRTSLVEKFMFLFFGKTSFKDMADYLFSIFESDDDILEEKARVIFDVSMMLIRGVYDLDKEDTEALASVIADLKGYIDKNGERLPRSNLRKISTIDDKEFDYNAVLDTLMKDLVPSVNAKADEMLTKAKLAASYSKIPSAASASSPAPLSPKAKSPSAPLSPKAGGASMIKPPLMAPPKVKAAVKSAKGADPKEVRDDVMAVIQENDIEKDDILGYRTIDKETGEVFILTEAEIDSYMVSKLLGYTNLYKYVGFDPEVIRDHYKKVFGPSMIMIVQVIAAYIAMGANFEARASKSNDTKEAQKFVQLLKSKGVATNKQGLLMGKHLTLPRIAGSFPFLTLALRIKLHEKMQLPNSGIKTEVSPIYQDMSLSSLSDIYDCKDFLKKMARQLNQANTLKISAEIVSAKKNEDKERLAMLVLKDEVAEDRAEQYRQLSVMGLAKDPCYMRWGKDSKDKSIKAICEQYGLE